jgi:sRNA-binding regulator protein Hfq
MTANRPADAPHKTPDIWGASSAGFYAEMEGERLVVDLVNAEQVHGMLLGVDRYDIFLRDDQGEKVLIAKGAITTVRRDPATLT